MSSYITTMVPKYFLGPPMNYNKIQRALLYCLRHHNIGFDSSIHSELNNTEWVHISVYLGMVWGFVVCCGQLKKFALLPCILCCRIFCVHIVHLWGPTWLWTHSGTEQMLKTNHCVVVPQPSSAEQKLKWFFFDRKRNNQESAPSSSEKLLIKPKIWVLWLSQSILLEE